MLTFRKFCDNIRRALSGETFTTRTEVFDLVFEMRYSPLADEENNVLGVIGVATDVTEQRRAEVVIRENEERYRELFENANDIIYTHDLAGNFTSLNRSGERITATRAKKPVTMNVARRDRARISRSRTRKNCSQNIGTRLDCLRNRHHL